MSCSRGASRRAGHVGAARAVAVLLLALGGVLAAAPVASAASVAGAAPIAAAAPAAVAEAPATVLAAGAPRPMAGPMALPMAPDGPTDPASPGDPAAPAISVEIGGTDGSGRTQSVTIIALLTVLSVAPAVLMLMTSFTKIAVVLALTRQALGTPTIPPNQVLAGLALFLSLFVMGPVLSQVNDQAVQPYLNGDPGVSQQVAIDRGLAPMKTFMLEHTGTQELQTMVRLSQEEAPATREDTSMTTLVPAFVISELKTAFIIGFVIFIPFLIIDLVVASVLMSMGMMMLPPVMISLPFKLLLFIMVDGWSLITTALVTSYR